MSEIAVKGSDAVAQTAPHLKALRLETKNVRQQAKRDEAAPVRGARHRPPPTPRDQPAAKRPAIGS
jgi:hypothetical protein